MSKFTVRIALTDADTELFKKYMETNGWKTYVNTVIDMVVNTVRMYDEHRDEYEKLQKAIGRSTADEYKAFAEKLK